MPSSSISIRPVRKRHSRVEEKRRWWQRRCQRHPRRKVRNNHLDHITTNHLISLSTRPMGGLQVRSVVTRSDRMMRTILAMDEIRPMEKTNIRRSLRASGMGSRRITISGTGSRSQSDTTCEIRVKRPTAASSKQMVFLGLLILSVYCGERIAAVGEHENVVRKTETGIKQARMPRQAQCAYSHFMDVSPVILRFASVIEIFTQKTVK